MLKKLRKKIKGQSTVEYLILVAGVIALLLVFVGGNTGVFQTSLNSTYTKATDGMTNMAERLRGSRP